MRATFREFLEAMHDPFSGVPPHERRTPAYALRVLLYWIGRAGYTAILFVIATGLACSGVWYDEPPRRTKW